MLRQLLKLSLFIFCLAAASGDKTAFASPLFDTAQTVQVNGRGANLTTIQNLAESNRIDSLGSEVFSVGAEIEKSADLEKLQVNFKNSTEMPQSLLSSQPCIVRDDFNRANSTNMGANWTEQAGDFSISGNRAVGISDSEIVYNGNTTGDLACVDFYSGGNAQKVARILLKYTSSSDHLRVLLQDSLGDGLYDRIYFDREGFVFNAVCATSLLTTPIPSGRLTAYLDGTTLRGDIDNDFNGTIDQSYQCTNAPQKSGTKVVLSNFGPAQFDNFGTPPNTLTVTKTADTNDGVCNADCSLREAIAAAASGDKIEFASPLFDSPQEIQLSGQLLINKDLTINGTGANLLTLRQTSASSRVIQMQNVTTVNLSGMTITGGNLGNGAGINAGYSNFPIPPGLTLNFSGLNVTGNSCGGGGCGISTANYNLNLTNSTVSNNSSSFCCGQGGPGGIQFTGANTFNLINSTVSGNTADNNNSTAAGGIWFLGTTLNVINSTITDNGANGGAGGVNVGNGNMTVRNSIIAGNRNNTNTPDVTKTGSSTVVSLGNNIIGNAPGIGFTDGVNNDRVGNSTTPFNPLLGTLTNNGGSTPTHALLPASQAINNGNNCVTDLSCSANNPPFALTTDQRGKSRVGQIDIGAFEAPLNLVVTNTNDSGAGSLRNAIGLANSTPDDEIITFNIPSSDSGCVNGVCTIILTSGELGINSVSTAGFLFIQNPNGTADNLRVSGNNLSRVFFVNSGANVYISGLTVTGGKAPTQNLPNCTLVACGGGINNLGTLTLANSIVSNSSAEFGGGIANGGTLTLTNSTVNGNTGFRANGSFGGGISNTTGGTVNLTNSTVSNNSAGSLGSNSRGGGIDNSSGGTVNLTGSTLSGNSVNGASQNSGGGISNGGTVNLTNSTVSGNIIGNSGGLNRGGGIFNGGTLNSTNSTLSGNSANGSGTGGGILNASTINARNTIISGNTATSSGANLSGSFNVNDSNVVDNEANVLLAPLGFYGGATMTHPLLSGSTAVNNGNNCVISQTCASFNAPAVLTGDQRGANRVGNVDVGAFEVNNSQNGGNYRASLPFARQGVNYNFVITPNNGTATYQVTNGNLPQGVNLTTALAPNAVVSLGGVPTQSGFFDFSITTTSGANSNVTDYRLGVIPTTSANVSISGRVFTNDGNALRNAAVLLIDTNGNTRTVKTGSFGIYRIDELAVGQTYFIQVVSKKFTFAPQTVFLTDNLTDLNFTAQ